jgi:hypothetical protein
MAFVDSTLGACLIRYVSVGTGQTLAFRNLRGRLLQQVELAEAIRYCLVPIEQPTAIEFDCGQRSVCRWTHFRRA